MSASNPLRLRWLWSMAWRDSRQSRSRLLLFTLSIVLGIAALVAINSFRANLENDIETESKALLGADLVISHNQPLSDSAMSALRELDAEMAREKAFASMVVFPKAKATRLVQVRALEGGFPFFGELETVPATAASAYQSGKRALLDQTVALQFGMQPGDSIRVGRASLAVSGNVTSIPGQAGIAASMAPPVLMPMEWLEETDLLSVGSRVIHKEYFRFTNTAEVDAAAEALKPMLEAEGARIETFNDRKERVGDAFGNLSRFLNLVGFIALLLGCVGVASSVHLYVREKLAVVAVLRCLGLSGTQAFLIYLFQVFAIGLVGSLLGAIAGSGIQVVLPKIFENFLLLDVSSGVSPQAVLSGVVTGVLMSVLFALLPLLSIRKASPLLTLSSFYEEKLATWDWRRLAVVAGIILFVFGFAYLQMEHAGRAAIFTGGLLIAFLGLAGAARLLMWLVRKFFPVSWSFTWRQALANLYRPNNQTVVLIVAIGLGTALLTTLYATQGMLLGQLQVSEREGQPNMIVFDIRHEQKDEVLEFTREQQLPIAQEVPVVGMRLVELRGRKAEDLKNDSTVDIPDHVFNREYRVTYRDELISSERELEGEWPVPEGKAGVSLEEGLANSMNAELGDELVFNIAGARVPMEVTHIRKVDWARVQTNFTVLFPSAVLEDAPQMHVLMTRASTPEESARFQQELVTAFPNVSVIDLELILQTLDEVLDQVFFAIQFMALFSIITGLIVLAGSVTVSKFQRVRDSVLLRTIGASRLHILGINAVEYLILGGLASITGIGLAFVASWALATYSFEIDFVPPISPLAGVFVIITGLTVGIGLLNVRSILTRPPLEVLRREV